MDYPVNEFMFSPDPESVMRQHLGIGIASRRQKKPSSRRHNDRQLALLLVGYSGAYNTGADTRVAEIVRQLRILFGNLELRIGLTVISPHLPEALQSVDAEPINDYFPAFIHQACDRYDGIIACEGSMFTSTFSDTLTIMMAGALGHAGACGKLAVGYGAEAGAMSPELEAFVRLNCAQALITARNQASYERLAGLGLRARLGADTAWTYSPSMPIDSHGFLRQMGWKNNQPMLVVCPINPFWWPVKPDVERAMILRMQGQSCDTQYGAFSFHHESESASQRYRTYLDGLAQAISRYCRKTDAFPVIIGMEQLDAKACRDLAALIDKPAPCLVAGEQPMDLLIHMLRSASLLISSRFHALVLSMPAGVPSCGIAIDNRISTLMRDRGHTHLQLQADDAELDKKLFGVLEQLDNERDTVAESCQRMVALELRRFGEMGKILLEELAARRPDLPLQYRGEDWRPYLPPLDEKLSILLEKYP